MENAYWQCKGHSDFFKKVVFSLIESNYRVDDTKRTFVGVPLSDLFGTDVLFNEPETFSGYVLGAHQSGLTISIYYLSKRKSQNRKQKEYLSVGNLETPEFGEGQGMVMGVQLLAKKISTPGSPNLTLRLSTIEYASHSTAFPTTSIEGLSCMHGN